MSCNNVILFYSRPYDAHTINIFTTFLDFLKENGVTSYCIQQKTNLIQDGLTKKEIIDNLNMVIQQSKVIAKAKSLEDCYVQDCLQKPWLMDFESRFRITPNLILSEQEKAKELMKIKKYIRECGDAMSSIISMIKKSDDLDLNFYSIDVPYSLQPNSNSISKTTTQDTLIETVKIRSKYMADKILEQCSKGDIVSLIEPLYFEISTLLRENGARVKEYFIVSSPIIKNGQMSDSCLRSIDNGVSKPSCKNHKFDGLVIDLHYNEFLNPFLMIAHDLNNFYGLSDL